MPGPAPKPAATRARRNKKSTAAKLEANPEAEVPDLPEPPQIVVRNEEGEIVEVKQPPWHPAVIDEWEEIWMSPMASQFIPTDGHGLLKMIFLTQEFWVTDDPQVRKSLHGEIRITRRDYGLTPTARASLHWEIIRTEEAAEKRKRKLESEGYKPADAEGELAALNP